MVVGNVWREFETDDKIDEDDWTAENDADTVNGDVTLTAMAGGVEEGVDVVNCMLGSKEATEADEVVNAV